MKPDSTGRRGVLKATGSAAVLAVLPAACAPVAIPSADEAALRSVGDKDLLRLVPPFAELALFLDLDALRESPWTRAVVQAASAADRTAALAARGYDEIRDIDRLVTARMRSATVETPPLEIAQGRLDLAQIERVWLSHHPKALVHELLGKKILESESEALAFLTARTIALGPPIAVRGVLDVFQGRGTSLLDEIWVRETRSAFEDSFPAARKATALVLAAPGPSLQGELQNLTAGLEPPERLIAALELGRRLELTALGFFGRRYEANDLAERVRAELAKLSARKAFVALGLDRTLKQTTVTVSGRRILLTLFQSPDDREALALRLATLISLLRSANDR